MCGAAEAPDRGLDVRGPGNSNLAAAVVPASRRLEPERRAEVRCGCCEGLRRRDGAPWSDRDPRTLHEPALCQPVLRQRRGSIPGGPVSARCRADNIQRDMLELVGDDVGVRSELLRRSSVVVGTDHDPVRDRRGGTLGSGSRTTIR